ncbi:MAG TPA: bifunctional adenosylcobinamide kinase/adenosylcobinamide-phosphate guanylyltransferase [Caulobacteraceae bacterium]|jgi:adenosylcobinamide kinase/adenosylcobinamide-phosphate guanylyltransferase|nr:bifunctional adenosylcobinamide kinase/adenosylcobinamide-phosphate guanylyltransferase [Caulobacteraceae bacterium]
MSSTLILGGARSGKSAWAQGRAEAAGGRLVTVVTARALDAEMAQRIARHRADRGGAWTTVEAPVDLTGALATLQPGDTAVVDCLTLWLSNLMHAEAELEPAFAALDAAVAGCPAQLLLVSNEVGQGIVPDNALARAFRDHAGCLHQRLARTCDEAVLIVAGLPLWLKRA